MMTDVERYIMHEYIRIVKYAYKMKLVMSFKDCYKQARSNARYVLRQQFLYPDG